MKCMYKQSKRGLPSDVRAMALRVDAVVGIDMEYMISMIIPMIWVIEIKFCAAPYCVQQEIYGVERTWELALLILGVLNI